MNELTQRQSEVLEYIAGYWRENGMSPTYQEIADHFGMASKFGVVRHIEALVQKGHVQRSGSTARSFRLISTAAPSLPSGDGETVRLPVVGRVAAGSPILSEGNIEEWLTLPRQLAKDDKNYFTVQVQGDSMVNAGIFDGDLVVVKNNSQPTPGNIVVALVDGEVTVKRLRSGNGRQFLQAENPDYDDIYPENEWQIQGQVVSLIRSRVE